VRPTALRASFTAARALQSYSRSSRQESSFPDSLRRGLALRAVLCAFFGGAPAVRSLAADWATDFSETAAGTWSSAKAFTA
jgi:hypothetical protein